MNKDDEKRIAAKLAKIMAMLCIRNTQLETLHVGLTPATRSGDYSDVFGWTQTVGASRGRGYRALMNMRCAS